jgi:hypothetical protein
MPTPTSQQVDNEHTPPLQSSLAWQMTPHAPQLVESALVSAHTPEQHCCIGAHALPQAPQFAGSLPSDAQNVPHDCCVAQSSATHVPFAQTVEQQSLGERHGAPSFPHALHLLL